MNYDELKLKNQLCFPLYAASRELIKCYREYLEQIGLTYTQYIVMLVLWEERVLNVKALGKRLYLDSGTLTPVLKSLEAKGYVIRTRSSEDERRLMVEVTPEGDALKQRATEIPHRMDALTALSDEEATQLYHLLYKLLNRDPDHPGEV